MKVVSKISIDMHRRENFDIGELCDLMDTLGWKYAFGNYRQDHECNNPRSEIYGPEKAYYCEIHSPYYVKERAGTLRGAIIAALDEAEGTEDND